MAVGILNWIRCKFWAICRVFFDKKVGDFNKMESKSLDFTGLKIPRNYLKFKGRLYFEMKFLFYILRLL